MGCFYSGNYNTKYIVCADDGHGLETLGKRTPDGYKENEFNNMVKYYMFDALTRCGIGCYDVSPDRNDNSLQDRTDSANNLIKSVFDANRMVYVSIHYDAFTGEWGEANGLTVYIYPGTDRRLANNVHKYLVQGTKQTDRGIKEADFHVLRETIMPAILTENGFMDNKYEAGLMKDRAFQKEVGEEHCKGICEYFGVPYVAPIIPVPPSNYYRVQVGAFRDKANAEKLLKELKTKGYDGFVV